jgi:hypothetical protein
MNAPPFGDLTVGDGFRSTAIVGIMVNARGERLSMRGGFRNYISK